MPEELWRELDAHGVIRISADGWVAFKATKRGPSVRKKGEPRKASEPAAKRRKASGDHEDEEVKNKLRDLLGKDDDHMIENLMVSKALKDVVMMAARCDDVFRRTRDFVTQDHLSMRDSEACAKEAKTSDPKE